MILPTPLRATLALLAVCAALWAAGCASPGGLQALLVDGLRAQIHERGLNPDDVELPFALNAEMRDWVRDRASLGGDPENRLEQLLQQLINRGDVPLKYESGHTGTAREVWESGRANCLAFTHLFVGMAREVITPTERTGSSTAKYCLRPLCRPSASISVVTMFGLAQGRQVRWKADTELLYLDFTQAGRDEVPQFVDDDQGSQRPCKL